MSARRRVAATLAAALLFAAATPWVLRPWFLHADEFPRSESTVAAMADADLYLNVWILAWVAHALGSEPRAVFHGNIYHPAPHTLAGSENMLAHAPVTVPVMAATGSALGVLKAMALESFVANGVALFLLVLHHTGSAAAGLVAGAAFALTPWRPATMPQPQYLGTQYLPLALLAVDCWLARRRLRALAGLAAALALQALACLYVGYFTLIAVPAYAAARILSRGTVRRAAAATGVAAAIAAAGVAVLPAALPYLAARAEGSVPVHDPALITVYSWAPWAYLGPGLVERTGVVPLALVALGLLVLLVRGRSPLPEGATWALVAVGVLFSAGPSLRLLGVDLPLPYVFFYRFVPGFSAIRAPVRFFIVVVTGLAALGGYAFARVTARWPRALRAAAAVALLVACAWSAAPRPAQVVPAQLGRYAPEVERWLAAEPAGGAVVEIPAWYLPGDIIGDLRDARHMVASTIHWHPILNGYTGYPPPNAPFLGALIRRLPDADALGTLVASVDLRWIVVHRADLVSWEVPRWREVATPGLALAARFGTDEVYAVTATPAHDWRAEIVPRIAHPWPTTLEGTPTVPLAAACRSARFVDVTPPPLMISTTFPQPIPVRFENASACRWPALGVRAEGLVVLTYQWVGPSGKRYGRGPLTRLAHDVAPGTTVDDDVMVLPAGGERGRWTLEVMLAQQGVDEPLATRAVEIEVRGFGG